VFGFSFSELVVLAIVALIVIGPKDLPKVLRKVGMWAGKLRRMAADLRAQSGIDDVLRTEGLADDLAEIRKLARGELDDVRRAVESLPKTAAAALATDDPLANIDVDVQREYPREGADAFMALPDTAILYANSFPKSAFAREPLYMLGDADGKLPDEEPEAKKASDSRLQPAEVESPRGAPSAQEDPSDTSTSLEPGARSLEPAQSAEPEARLEPSSPREVR
jgi:sec-independent protein translocase protein TatB